MKTYNRGFGSIAIIVLLALGLVVGGGVYKSVKTKNSLGLNATSSVVVQEDKGNKGTLRDFLSFGKRVSCTWSMVSASGTTTGMVYIDSPKMRGDFGTSHMIRMNNDVYVWMGTQGAKLNISDINKATSTPTGTGASVDLDQKVDYSCMDWDGDESKFILPTDVKFYDIANLKIPVKAGY